MLAAITFVSTVPTTESDERQRNRRLIDGWELSDSSAVDPLTGGDVPAKSGTKPATSQ